MSDIGTAKLFKHGRRQAVRSRLDHASRLEQLESAFAALGQTVLVSVYAAA
jgi:hypothetical protein